MVWGWGMSFLQHRLPLTIQRYTMTDNTPLPGESEDAHQQVYDQGGEPDHQAKFSHELIAGAASFEGFKLFEDHQRKEGQIDEP